MAKALQGSFSPVLPPRTRPDPLPTRVSGAVVSSGECRDDSLRCLQSEPSPLHQVEVCHSEETPFLGRKVVPPVRSRLVRRPDAHMADASPTNAQPSSSSSGTPNGFGPSAVDPRLEPRPPSEAEAGLGDVRLRHGVLGHQPPEAGMDKAASPGVFSASSSASSHKRPGLIRRLKPLMVLLQLFGYYPSFYKVVDFSRWGRLRWLSYVLRVLLLKYTLATVAVSLYLFRGNITTTIMFNSIFELLHAQTISSIILGLKPLINAVVVLAFLFNIRRHHKFLNQVEQLDRLFFQEFGADPGVVGLNVFVGVAVVLTHALFTAVRVTEHMFFVEQDMERLGQSFIQDSSFVVVPIMTTAAVMPLLYFEVCNRLMRFWAKALRRSIKRELCQRPIKFYYQMFLQLARTQDLMGKAFNPFVLFSLGWSVFSLCLTIYFATQSDSHFTPPPPSMAPPAYQWLLIIVFNQAYGGLQVLLALVYISVLSFTGTATNEKTRYVVRDLLGALPDNHDPAGRFYVTCFIYKINSQYMWGVTVWRAFPLERSTFFTIVSMILTYAFLLLKFKANSDEGRPGLEDLLQASNLTNATL